MKQIRYGVFETNSSSTHSLTICPDEEYKKFQSGELMYDTWDNGLVNKNALENQGEELDGENYSTYDEYFDDDSLETFDETYITKGGEVIHVFGKYGYDR